MLVGRFLGDEHLLSLEHVDLSPELGILLPERLVLGAVAHILSLVILNLLPQLDLLEMHLLLELLLLSDGFVQVTHQLVRLVPQSVDRLLLLLNGQLQVVKFAVHLQRHVDHVFTLTASGREVIIGKRGMLGHGVLEGRRHSLIIVGHSHVQAQQERVRVTHCRLRHFLTLKC